MPRSAGEGLEPPTAWFPSELEPETEERLEVPDDPAAAAANAAWRLLDIEGEFGSTTDVDDKNGEEEKAAWKGVENMEDDDDERKPFPPKLRIAGEGGGRTADNAEDPTTFRVQPQVGHVWWAEEEENMDDKNGNGEVKSFKVERAAAGGGNLTGDAGLRKEEEA